MQVIYLSYFIFQKILLGASVPVLGQSVNKASMDIYILMQNQLNEGKQTMNLIVT